MGLEVVMRQKVGDGKAMVDAEGTIICVASQWLNTLTLNVTIPNDTETPDSYTKNDFSDPNGDDEVLAQEVVDFLNGIGLSAVRDVAEVTVMPMNLGRVGNDIVMTTNNSSALVITQMANGRDENEAVEMELTLEDDDDLILKVDGNVIFKTPYMKDSFENDEPFERNLTHFLKKSRC